MEVDQALRALSQLKDAAPPTTSARLGEVITLVQALDEHISDLSAQVQMLDERNRGLNGRVRMLDEQKIELSTQVQTLDQYNTDLTLQLAALAQDETATLLAHALDVARPSLSLVRDQAQGLREGRLGQLTTEQCDSLTLIDDHAGSTLTLLETINDVTMLRQNALEIEPLLFSGLDLLAQAWQQSYHAAEQHEHQITVHADDPLPAVVGDYRQILEIVDDLLDNAIHYTPFGGSIRLMAESLGTQVLFTVTDNGIGLAKDELSHVGEPFWRALHQPLVRQHAGSGLRLYRARLVLAAHESELFFSGEPGMGSSFSFILPTT